MPLYTFLYNSLMYSYRLQIYWNDICIYITCWLLSVERNFSLPIPINDYYLLIIFWLSVLMSKYSDNLMFSELGNKGYKQTEQLRTRLQNKNKEPDKQIHAHRAEKTKKWDDNNSRRAAVSLYGWNFKHMMMSIRRKHVLLKNILYKECRLLGCYAVLLL
jgi:hypothetical protein